MLAESRLLPVLQNNAVSPAGLPMCLYGDPAYPIRAHLISPYRVVPLTPQMEAFNSSMSKVRQAVEWLFNDVAASFKFIDFKKNLKIGLSCVGKMYLVCAILRNTITCLYGNLTSEYFGVDPPRLFYLSFQVLSKQVFMKIHWYNINKCRTKLTYIH